MSNISYRITRAQENALSVTGKKKNRRVGVTHSGDSGLPLQRLVRVPVWVAMIVSELAAGRGAFG